MTAQKHVHLREEVKKSVRPNLDQHVPHIYLGPATFQADRASIVGMKAQASCTQTRTSQQLVSRIFCRNEFFRVGETAVLTNVEVVVGVSAIPLTRHGVCIAY